MKAMRMMASGGPEVLRLEEIDEPQVQSDTQIKVRLKAAGVNPVDTKLRSRGLLAGTAPAILGCDGAGVVVEAGASVTNFRPGDEVWFCSGGLGGPFGNYAELTVVEQNAARLKPTSLSFAQAAAAPLVLITAWEALYERARLHEGQNVLIHGGAGGVGHVAIQLAKRVGARVCTTVGSPQKADFVATLGADEVIRYKEHDFVSRIAAWSGGHGVDVALDTVGGETFRRTFAAMAFYGDLVTLLDPGADVVWKEARTRNLRIGFELMLTPMLHESKLPQARDHHGEILERCGQWFNEGSLKIHVDKTFPLSEAAQAHALVEQGHGIGKVVLSID